jgi:hypothetical protein
MFLTYYVSISLQVTEPEFDWQDSKQGRSWVSLLLDKGSNSIHTLVMSGNIQLFCGRKVNGEVHTIDYSLRVAYL